MHSQPDSSTVAIHHAKNEPLCETCAVWVRQITAPGPRTDAVIMVDSFPLPADVYWALAARAHAAGMQSVMEYLVWQAQTIVDETPPKGVLRTRLEHQVRAALDSTFAGDDEIAARFGVDASFVERLRKRFEIPGARERKAAHFDPKIAALASDGISDPQIARALDLTQAYVRQRRQARRIASGYKKRSGGAMPASQKPGS